MLDLARNQIQHLSANTLYKTFDQPSPQHPSPGLPRRLIARVLNLHDNPLVCDEDLGWLVKWLRERLDIQISTPGAPPTSCAAPPMMRGVSLRSVDIREREEMTIGVSNTVHAETGQAPRRRWPERTALPHATTTPHPLTPMHSTARGAAGTGVVAGVQHGPSSAHVADTSLAVLLLGGLLINECVNYD